MAKWTRKTTPRPEVPGTVGTVRFVTVGTSDVDEAKAGDVVVIKAPDLDRRTAESLVRRRVAAVLNVTDSSSGRYPNIGPRVLAAAGILLIDGVGAGATTRLKSGDTVRLNDGSVFRNGTVVVTGRTVDIDGSTAALEDASRHLSTQLDSLAANATHHLQREHELLLEGHGVPTVSTQLRDRPVVVVVDSFDVAEDLKGLRRFIRDQKPLLIGAGPGADVLLAAGLTPDITLGALDHISDRALSASKELVVIAPTGHVKEAERLEKHRQSAEVFRAFGTDEELALLLADSSGASSIIHVGAPPTLIDFIEQGAGQTGSAFISRLRAGTRLIDAKAVARFYRHRVAWWPVVALLAAGVVAVAVAVATTPVGSDWYNSLFDTVRGWF